MSKRLKKICLILFVLASVIVVAACTFLQHPKFDGLSEGERISVNEKSPNFRNGEFRNQIPTPMFTDDSSFVSVLMSNLMSRSVRLKPDTPIPSAKTDLKSFGENADVIVWLGHSSYFMQLDGKRILVDPVFSSYASPLPLFNRAFDGTNIYSAEDFPEIDYLLITHDHWDHLDYSTVKALESKVRNVICGLGVGSYFRKWGYPSEKIMEGDWNTQLKLAQNFSVHILPARHYSGRQLNRNKTLWVGFVLITPNQRVFLSGDSGYGPHFSEVGKQFNGFDLAILDSGQYDRRWAYIHMNPEDAVRAAGDLKAKALLPGHIGRFAISRHSWDEPFIRIEVASLDREHRLLMPMIGAQINLDDKNQKFFQWWNGNINSVSVIGRSDK